MKRTMPEAAPAADGAEDAEYQLVQRACTLPARLALQAANGEAESREEQLQNEVRVLRHRLVDVESARVDANLLAERCRKGQQTAEQVARELQQRMEAAEKKYRNEQSQERSARADKQELQVRAGCVCVVCRHASC